MRRTLASTPPQGTSHRVKTRLSRFRPDHEVFAHLRFSTLALELRHSAFNADATWIIESTDEGWENEVTDEFIFAPVDEVATERGSPRMKGRDNDADCAGAGEI